MNLVSRVAQLLALLLLVAGCSSVPKAAGELAADEDRVALQTRLQKELGLSIEIANPMPEAALLSIQGALFVPKWYKFRPVSAGHPFARFFGSNSVDSVYGFLKDRIHHFGVMRFEMEEQLKRGQIYALNTGAMLWQVKELSYRSSIMLGGNEVDAIDSPRYGLVELTPSTLIGAKVAREADADRFLHFAIFAHEARHSDCTGGVNRAQGGSFKSLPLLCSYHHTACKSGTGPMEGDVACDPLFWGAYSTEYAVLDAIADSCIGCTSVTRGFLKWHAIDAASRINPLPDTLTSQIMAFLAKDADYSEPGERVMDGLTTQINAVMMADGLPAPDLSSAGE